MAKAAAQKTKKEESRALATTPKGAVATRAAGGMAIPEDIADLVDASTGRGTSSDTQDNLVPLIYILQALSPQVNKRNDVYIDGAEPGMIWLKNAGDAELVDGEKGFLWQQCAFSKAVIEWIPRDQGGGFVAKYDMSIGESVEACLKRHGVQFEKVKDPKNPRRTRLVKDDGHELVEVREHIGHVILDDGRMLPYVIGMTGSNHTVSRGMNTFMRGITNSKNVPVDSWLLLMRMTTQFTSNASGEWFKWNYEHAGYVSSREQAQRGAALAAAFESGEKVAETPVDLSDDGGVDLGGDDDGQP